MKRVVALLIGLALGTGLVLLGYKLSTGNGGKVVEAEKQEKPSVAITVAPPQPAPQVQPAAKPVADAGMVLDAEPMLEKGVPVGATLQLRQPLEKAPDTGKVYTEAELPGISLQPQLAFKGQWESNDRFTIRWSGDKLPDSVAVMATELPGSEGKPLKVTDGSSGPHIIVAPVLQMTGFVVNSIRPREWVTLQIIWSEPVSLDDLEKSLHFEVRAAGASEWKAIRDSQVAFYKAGSAGDSQTVTIRDSRLRAGDRIRVADAGKLQLGHRKVRLTVSGEVEVRPSATAEIGQPMPKEGSDFFSIEVPFVSRASGERYASGQARVDAASAKQYIRVTPEVAFEVVPGVGSFRLVGAFEPDTHYSIEFLPGLHGSKSEWLMEKVERQVHTGVFKPSLNFIGKARYLPRLDGAELPFEYRNVDKIRIHFRRIPPQNLVFWMSSAGESAPPNLSEELLVKDMALEMRKDKRVRGMIDLSDLARAGKGVYQVSLSRLFNGGKNEAYSDSAMVVVTDLAAVTKLDGSDLHVWTRSARDFDAQSDVKVQVMSYNNFEIASCTTDSDGSCVLKGVMKQTKKPYALIMSTKNDLSYMRFSDVALPLPSDQEAMRAYTSDATAMEAYVYASRGVYRPGEKVNLAGLVWTGERKAAKGVPLSWKILSPRQKVLLETAGKSSPFGMMSIDYQLDDFAATGEYKAVLYSGKKQLSSYSFFVEEFVPERIGLKVKPKEKLTVGNAAVRFDVDAKYLFGPPVAGGDYSARFSLAPAWYTVPGNKGFSTGEYRTVKPVPVVLQPKIGKLDDQGLAQLTASTEGLADSFPTVMRLTANVDVSESGSGRVTHRRATTLVSASNEIVGLHLLKASSGEIEVEGRLFTPAGEPVKRDGKVQLSLLQIYSNWSYAYDPDVGYNQWQREDVLLPEAGNEVIDVKQGKFTARLHTRNGWGQYLVRARLPEHKQLADLQVSMGYSWYWGGYGSSTISKPRAPDQVQVELSKQEAQAGDEVSLTFDAPFAGRALFALEADRLLDSRWLEVKKGPNTLTFKAPDVLPNVHASMLIIKDPREGEMYVPARAWGGASLKIVPSAFKVDVDTELPDEMRPGRDLTIHLANGGKGKAEYTVAVVDEGILQLTRFKTPDPLAYFFSPRRSGVSTHETVGWTFPRSMKSSRNPGGDAAPAAKNGGRVVPVRLVSYWSGIVTSDDSGQATVKVPVPQFQGKLRVMVVAAQDGRTGHAEKDVTVRDPLVLQPTLPRFLQWGDQLEIPLFVVNMTGAEQKVVARVESDAGVLLEKQEASVTIPNMGSATLKFPARVKAFAGKAGFRFEISAGKFVTRDTATIPIQPLSPERSINVVLPADKPFRLAELIPDDMRRDGLKVQISASAMPYVSELKRLRYLLHYPYGCIEQTTSSTMPLLYVGKLLKVLDPDALKDVNVENMVYSGINRLLSMQTISGGFAYWPGGTEPVLWGTAYATHLLLKARDLGYQVPETALKDALNFMEEALTSRRYLWQGAYHYFSDSEAYMIYVLGLAGRHQKSLIRNLAEHGTWEAGRTVENNFLLMLAAHMAGESEVEETLMKHKDLFSSVEVAGRTYTGSYWSAYRTDAMRLSLAEDVWPGDSKLDALTRRVAARLASDRYLNTQEVAWAVSALGKIVERFEGASVEGVSLAAAGKAVKPDDQEKLTLGWRFYGDAVPLNDSLKLNYKGKAPFLYASIVGYDKNPAVPADQSRAFDVQRSYLNLKGERIDPLAIRQGELIAVHLHVRNRSDSGIENMALVDRLPSGFEIENPNLGRSEAMDWLDKYSELKPAYVDRRDDRIQLFFDMAYDQSSDYFYIVRAVSNGHFMAPPAKLEAMYEPEIHAYSDYSKTRIQAP